MTNKLTIFRLSDELETILGPELYALKGGGGDSDVIDGGTLTDVDISPPDGGDDNWPPDQIPDPLYDFPRNGDDSDDDHNDDGHSDAGGPNTVDPIYGGGSSNSGNNESSDLNPEQQWFIEKPLKGVAALYHRDYAEFVAHKFPGIHNGYGDALRHALFTALNANAFGKDVALQLGVAHEHSAPIIANEYAMDIHNNQWGANYGSSHDTIDINQFMSDFNEAVSEGNIIIINFDGAIPNPSSDIDDFVYDGSEHYSGN